MSERVKVLPRPAIDRLYKLLVGRTSVIVSVQRGVKPGVLAPNFTDQRQPELPNHPHIS